MVTGRTERGGSIDPDRSKEPVMPSRDLDANIRKVSWPDEVWERGKKGKKGKIANA